MNKEIKKISLPIERDENDAINPRNPAFKWLFRIIITILATFSIVYFFSNSLSRIIVSHIDIDTERAIFQDLMVSGDAKRWDIDSLQVAKNHTGSADILRNFDEIYTQNDDMENAFATLGAKIILTEKLLENAKNEEEIFFILGHERAHIENRDILIGIAKNAPISLTLEAFGLSSWLINIEQIVSTKFSRDAEYRADEGGFNLLADLGLNSACATRFFESHANGFEVYSQYISTHPDTNLRLKNLLASNMHPDKPCTPIAKNSENTQE